MVIIKNGHVITMTEETAAAQRLDIAIDGERITRLEPEIAASPADTVVDAAGAYLLPGLIDSHCHLTYSGGMVQDELNFSVPERVIRASHNAFLNLLSGMTTVRDVGGIDFIEIAVRDGIRKGLMLGPRVISGGRMICMTGGHGWFYGVEADGPDAVRKAARESIKAHCDWVKFMASGGFAEVGELPGAPQLDLDELSIGVQEARKAGKKTAAHAHPASAIKNAVRAGIDSVEHCSFIDDEGIELMLERGTYAVPTFSIYYKMMTEGAQWGLAPYLIDLVKRSWERKMEAFSRLWKAGVKVAAGTDNGSPVARHGDLTTELKLLVTAGLSPYQALRCATAEAARMLGLDQEIGTLAPGMKADIVVLNANPLQDIGATRSVRSVFKDGKRYDPTAESLTLPMSALTCYF